MYKKVLQKRTIDISIFATKLFCNPLRFIATSNPPNIPFLLLSSPETSINPQQQFVTTSLTI